MRILCVGKLKEAWQRDACREYEKRLSRFDKVEICEVDDYPETDPRAMEREGEALLSRLREGEMLVALTLDGEMLDSEALARRCEAWRSSGRRVVFAIGGSLGLSRAVTERAEYKLCLSKMTFPHALARVILLEQLYRAHMILSGARYHK